MSTVTVILNQGQIEIPKHIRDELHWKSGHALILETTDSGVLLRAQTAKKPLRLEALRGFLKQDGGPPVSTDDLCAPVDASADWDAAERRSR
jgi:AbrB family looped-hinge helix DNA binding protein